MKKILLLVLCVLVTMGVANIALGASYTVKSGDTLTYISGKFDTTIQKIAEENNILNPDLIYAGQTLTISSGDLLGSSAGYTPVTGYESRLTSYVQASATTIPVASTKDISGQQISLSQISPSSTVYAYFTVEPNTARQESVACSGVTSLSWTNCVRGLPVQGGSMTGSSTLAFAHNASSKIIMTNIGQFYNNFLSVDGGAQDVYGTKTFTQNDFIFGDNTTGTGKRVLFRVGKTNNPYLKFIGPSGSNTTSTLVYSLDGTSELQINASGTTVGVAAGGGLQLSGGLLSLKTSDPQTWTGAWTLNNQVTVSAGSGALYVPTPTDVANPVPLNYMQTYIAFGQATGTAGVALTAGQAVYVSATSSQIVNTNTSVASSTFQFIGIVSSSTASGQTVTYTKFGGINCNQSGLVAGQAYYLNGTGGQIATTPGANFAKIGRAISTTCIEVQAPKFVARGTISVPASTSAIYTDVGFYPAHITITGIGNSAGGGYSIGDDTNNNIYQNGSAGSFSTSTNAWFIRNNTPTTLNVGTVSAKSAYGFTITPSVAVSAVWLQYVAWSE